MLAACASEPAADWSAWAPIETDESLIAFAAPTEAALPNLRRQARAERHSGEREEYWWWDDGEAFVKRLPPNFGYRYHPDSPDIVRDRAERWTMLEELGIDMTAAPVRAGSNRVGRYHYVLAATARQRCLVAGQGLWPTVGQRVMTVPSTAGGYLTLYRCVDADEADGLEAEMTTLLDAMTLR